jgi:ABC-type spermidine/putrescine transport system permease subunit I
VTIVVTMASVVIGTPVTVAVAAPDGWETKVVSVTVAVPPSHG